MEVDPEQLDKAAERLRTLGGLEEDAAKALSEAVVHGAVGHAFELINGFGPVPTAMNASKANQLRWICEHAGRLVTQREVEIIFRITATSARSVLGTMLATYEESLREKFLTRMQSDAVVLSSGSAETGLTWTLRFTEAGTFEAARSELSRLGLLQLCEGSASTRKIILPRSVEIDGVTSNPLDLLGLAAPG